jgi:DNA-binding transcriptional LysR family regulator
LLERGLSLPKNIVQSSAMPLIMTLLRLSDMIVPLPEESVQPYCQSGLLSVLLKDIGVRIGPFGILTHRSRQLSPSAQIVVAALRETAAQLYAGLNNSRGARAAPGAPS